jgi:hypothetical protein
MKEQRFAVVVRYDGENPANQHLPDIYWHKAPKAAARRLAALINRRAKWVPKRTNVGTRFYIVDHEEGACPTQWSLTQFRKQYGV